MSAPGLEVNVVRSAGAEGTTAGKGRALLDALGELENNRRGHWDLCVRIYVSKRLHGSSNNLWKSENTLKNTFNITNHYGSSTAATTN